MYETFNSQSRNIGELLGANERARIRVPQFQRGYSWERKHVRDFWTDLTTFQKESAVKDGPDKYFLGPIVIRAESKQEIWLLDGQQRLGTATILFSVLRDIARALGIQDASDFARDVQVNFILKPDSSHYALELGELDALYFKETVQADPPTTKKPTLRSHRNIQLAKQVLYDSVKEKIASLNPTLALVELKKLLQIIRSDLIMACIPVASERDAFRIFETLNDRGLRLSVPDLLLNYLMRVANSPADRKKIRDYWNDMLESLGRRDINRFLRHMWVSKYGDLKSQDLFTALKKHIEDNTINSVDFIRSCSQECEHYVNLLDANEDAIGKAARYVRTLIKELDAQSALPPLLAAFPLMSGTDFETFAKWMLVFVARYSIIANFDSSGLENVFFALARDIRSMMADAKKAKQCMATIKTTLVKNAPSDERVKVAAAELVLSPEEARYIISRIATRMQTNTKEVKIDEANLEHVFPKRPSFEWKGVDDLEPLLWHIGNLTMLGERLNSDIANKGYDKKRPHYQKTTELKMAQELAKAYTKWNESTIMDRAEKLAPFVVEIWNFDNPSRV